MVAKYVSISGMTNLVDIARQIRKFTGKPVKPETIKKDLDELFQNAESFSRDLALKTWSAKVHEMYAETTEEIKEIQSVKDKMLAADPKLPQPLLKLLETDGRPEGTATNNRIPQKTKIISRRPEDARQAVLCHTSPK